MALSRSVRVLCGTILLTALGGSLLDAARTHALTICRSDPMVTLSNGITVDLHVTINDAVTDVRHVSYVLHGPPLPAATKPAGAVTSGSGWYTVSSSDGTGSISSLTYVPDNNVGNYDGDITVTTGVANTTMTAYMDWVSGSGNPTPTAPAQGHAGQNLHIHMHVA